MSSLTALPAWLSTLAERSWASGPPRGTLERIDAGARKRAVESVSEFVGIPVGRPLRSDSTAHGGSWSLEPWTSQAGRFTSAYDRLEIDCHGLEITHLDALNHFGLDGRWYKGVPSNPNEGVSLEEIASEPLLTRAVFLDIAEARGEPWVEVDAPVGRDDLDAALSLAQTDVERGDALLLYMGRDRLEATGRSLKPVADSPEGRPGVGAEGSRWIAEREASLVAWDLLDAHGPGQLPLSVHLLVWAIGLLLVDNCDFGVLRSHVCRKRPRVGMFVVCPLRIAGATGCAVNPLVLL